MRGRWQLAIGACDARVTPPTYTTSDRPEDLPATEVVVLHDPEAEKSLVILFFATEDDYMRGDEVLSAMPADDTPGRRTSVTKYGVPIRMTP